ncbi:DUF475 domain-containing protein [Shimazuella alba]|uniref:DUF475 domain-containing protein n=1 Tax=Shimazuella alba TaxID=2690964 RepID=A0A6I4W3B1_9BACL|nr:DUF475 domain-containing protein [Shimazuella alba]MXQ54782.1 DUF475 domain-containing protein [Shimazuella alba]
MGIKMLFLRTCAWSLAVAVFGLIMAAAYGGWIGVILVGAVGIILYAVSYETAISNFYSLKANDFPDFWRKILLRIGLPLIVFGVQLVFPIAIVSIIAWRNPVDVVTLALTDKTSYQQMTTDAHPVIASFVAGFLLAAFFDFFFEERERRWLQQLEKRLAKVGQVDKWAKWSLLPFDRSLMIYFIMVLIITASGYFGKFAYQYGGVHVNMNPWVWFSGTAGVLLYLFTKHFATISIMLLGQTKLVGLIRLHVFVIINVQCSFNGMVGAFSITNDIILLSLGLGLGAMFVCVLNIYWIRQVKPGTFYTTGSDGRRTKITGFKKVGNRLWTPYAYISHGFHYTCGVLAVINLVSIRYHIPEIITSLIGIMLIALSIHSSKRRTRVLAMNN